MSDDMRRRHPRLRSPREQSPAGLTREVSGAAGGLPHATHGLMVGLRVPPPPLRWRTPLRCRGRLAAIAPLASPRARRQVARAPRKPAPAECPRCCVPPRRIPPARRGWDRSRRARARRTQARSPWLPGEGRREQREAGKGSQVVIATGTGGAKNPRCHSFERTFWQDIGEVGRKPLRVGGIELAAARTLRTPATVGIISHQFASIQTASGATKPHQLAPKSGGAHGEGGQIWCRCAGRRQHERTPGCDQATHELFRFFRRGARPVVGGCLVGGARERGARGARRGARRGPGALRCSAGGGAALARAAAAAALQGAGPPPRGGAGPGRLTLHPSVVRRVGLQGWGSGGIAAHARGARMGVSRDGREVEVMGTSTGGAKKPGHTPFGRTDFCRTFVAIGCKELRVADIELVSWRTLLRPP